MPLTSCCCALANAQTAKINELHYSLCLWSFYISHSFCHSSASSLKVRILRDLEEQRGRKGRPKSAPVSGRSTVPSSTSGDAKKAFQPGLSSTVAKILALNLHWAYTCIWILRGISHDGEKEGNQVIFHRQLTSLRSSHLPHRLQALLYTYTDLPTFTFFLLSTKDWH